MCLYLSDYIYGVFCGLVLFLSKYEGLGIAFIEAQVAEVFIYASENMHKECDVTRNVKLKDLEKGELYLAKYIIGDTNRKREGNGAIREKFRINQYDISQINKNLYVIYGELYL